MMNGKFYVAVDCEGAACTVGMPGEGLSGPNELFAAKQAMREAAAAARALFDGGASEVWIWDNHGTGVNFDYDQIDPRCKIVLGSGHHTRFPGIDESFTGVLFIAYHAREGSLRATLAHSYCSSSMQGYRVNGVDVGEMEIDAAFAGVKRVPVLFASSDDVCVSQAKESFPWIETVETKKSLSWNSCVSLHPQAACERIYDGVRHALARLDEMKSYVFSAPLSLEIRYQRKDTAASEPLFDRDRKPFAFKDAFTRVGTLDSVSQIFD